MKGKCCATNGQKKKIETEAVVYTILKIAKSRWNDFDGDKLVINE